MTNSVQAGEYTFTEEQVVALDLKMQELVLRVDYLETERDIYIQLFQAKRDKIDNLNNLNDLLSTQLSENTKSYETLLDLNESVILSKKEIIDSQDIIIQELEEQAYLSILDKGKYILIGVGVSFIIN